MSDVIRFNIDNGDITFSGAEGVSLLFSFLLKAKYQKPMQAMLIFNEQMAYILNHIKNKEPYNTICKNFGAPFSREELFNIGKLLVEQADGMGWWKKSRQDKMIFIREIVSSPYSISDSDVDFIIESAVDVLESMRSSVKAADCGDVS